MKLKLLKILLFTILIPYTSISQSVIIIDGRVCFDTISASKIHNELEYKDRVIDQKSDSVCLLLEQNGVLKTNNEKCKDKLTNKNTGLWITASVNFLLGLSTYIFASLSN